MIKLLTIIGARPQIIKAAAISRAIRTKFADQVQEKILHTGQHYDENMSGVFFGELGIPEPDYNLHVGSGNHGEQTAKMITGIENVLLSERFDGVIVYGDTNSTLAAAVAAGKLHIPIYHVEAGLRSFNMAMPEEQNRIVCDHLSTILFAPTQTAVENLKEEGIQATGDWQQATGKRVFKNGRHQRVVMAGDVMYDNAVYFAEMAEERLQATGDWRQETGEKGFVLVTIHRDNNTDDPKRLEAIVRALLTIADEGRDIVLPLHPRTRKLLPQNLSADLYERLTTHEHIQILPPASFFDILMLEKHAQVVMTDSGGVQKEAFFFETPCVILRPETEWVEIVEAGAGILADADYERIVNAYHELSGKKVQFPKLFGDGQAAERIVEFIVHSS
ncbi:MAG: UDP-N-acetylglucosamine 2-epimerase (non-hydrolyzing) [Paludibacteraceae bacterium]|nr:UDP-N-acetylglucosamine 2-epimerase (non-hydrolyzing) [Paludibacteraceae bacterium]